MRDLFIFFYIFHQRKIKILIRGLKISQVHLKTEVSFHSKIVPREITSNYCRYSYIFHSFWFSSYTHNSSLILLILFYSVDMGQERMQNSIHYVPATRLFQRYNTMNANTVTASNGPTMKYHCTVTLAEKNKKILSHYGSSKHEGPEAKQVRYLLKLKCY